MAFVHLWHFLSAWECHDSMKSLCERLMRYISFSSTYFGWISWSVVSACCSVAEKHSGRVPGLFFFPREFHERLDSPTYVNSQDLHLTLYTIPFIFCRLLRWSLGFSLRFTESGTTHKRRGSKHKCIRRPIYHRLKKGRLMKRKGYKKIFK